jgi:hypothetical protein
MNENVNNHHLTIMRTYSGALAGMDVFLILCFSGSIKHLYTVQIKAPKPGPLQNVQFICRRTESVLPGPDPQMIDNKLFLQFQNCVILFNRSILLHA